MVEAPGSGLRAPGLTIATSVVERVARPEVDEAPEFPEAEHPETHESRPRETPGARSPEPGAPWLGRFAKLIAVATFFVIVAGGLVTSTGTGLSDRTWPSFSGKLFPRFSGETRFEHPHRLIAGTLGILPVAVAVWLWRRDGRPAM